MSWLTKWFPVFGESERRDLPEGVWIQCPGCQSTLYAAEVQRLQGVCSKCDHHMRLSARDRLNGLLDVEHRTELATDVQAEDRLKFKDSKKYKDRLSAAQKQTQEDEALVVMEGTLRGLPVVACAFEFAFIGGSMGAAVGERFVQGVEAALAKQCPFVAFTASGGARMQEGLWSLMQMSKTSAALARLSQAGLPYVAVLTDPTMGGVSASLATLADVILAEPKALIGFAGPRVIEQTVRETLPEGFQRSEFLLEHGAIDQVVHRHDLSERLHRLLSLLGRDVA